MEENLNEENLNTEFEVVDQSTMILDELLIMSSNLEFMRYVNSFILGVAIMLFCAIIVLLFFVGKGVR